jgi:hypothetical protein
MPHKKYHKTKCNCRICRNCRKRTCKHKRYKGGDMAAPQPTQSDTTQQNLDAINEKKDGVLSSISDFFGLSSSTPTQPTPAPTQPTSTQTAGKRRRIKRNKKNKTKKRKY